MGGNKSKIAGESARSVLAKRDLLMKQQQMANKSVTPKFNVDKNTENKENINEESIPGLPLGYKPKKVEGIKSQSESESTNYLDSDWGSHSTSVPSYAATGDVNPDVIAGIHSFNFVKSSSDATSREKFQQEMRLEPIAAIVREREMNRLLQEQRDAGNYSSIVVANAPFKISEEDMITMLHRLREPASNPVTSANMIDEEKLKHDKENEVRNVYTVEDACVEYKLKKGDVEMLTRACVRFPYITMEKNHEDGSMIKVAK